MKLYFQQKVTSYVNQTTSKQNIRDQTETGARVRAILRPVHKYLYAYIDSHPTSPLLG